MRFTKRLTGRQWAFDALVALVVLVLGIIGTVEIGNASDVEFLREADVFHYTFVVLMAAPLAFRRVYPIPVMAVVLGSWVIDRGLDYPETPGAVGVAIVFYTIGAELDRRQSFRIGGTSALVVVGWTTIGAIGLESVTSVAILTTTISTLTPLLIGREMHERRQRVLELEQRAEQAEIEREVRAKQAVLEERARIARELHDVVAHQMTVMILQAEGARRIAKGSDPRIIEALTTIRVAGHRALTDMRRTLGLLRPTEDSPETEPLPRLADLDQLIGLVEKAGVKVDVEVSGDPKDLSEGAELSAYRIVQESLTNAIRHGGPGVTATVTIEYNDEGVELVISDDGRGSTTSVDNGGHGLIGMRERIAVVGGEFEAGPKSGGGYQVRATIPTE